MKINLLHKYEVCLFCSVFSVLSIHLTFPRNPELKSEERISRRDQTEAEIVLTEQIEMKKSIVAICKEEEFLHLQTKRSSFIIDKQRKWAYCEHAKVCI